MPKSFLERPRLAGFDYVGPHTFHVTIVTRGREPILTGVRAVAVMLVLDAKHGYPFEISLYTLMPDHMHLLVTGRTEEANLVRFVQRFKQVTSHRCVQETGARLWQPSFFDHAIRRDEALTPLLRYLVENPVRAGLIDHSDRWPYQGGTLLAQVRSGDEVRPRDGRS